MLCNHQVLYSDDQIKKNELNGTCSMNGVEKRYIKVSVGRPKGKTPFGRSGVDGRILLKRAIM